MFDNIDSDMIGSELSSHEEILVYAYENIVKNNINISDKYLIIDEYQDCTQMQQKIIIHLLHYKKIKGLFLIGDRNQSIYTFYNNQTIDQFYDKLLNINIGDSFYAKEIETSTETKLKKLGIIKTNPLDANINEDPSPDPNTNSDPVKLILNHFETFDLRTNYRSTIEIVNLANCFVKPEEHMTSIYTYNKYLPKVYMR